jgi:hypothetical protein
MQTKLVPNKTYVELYVWLEASIEPEFSFWGVYKYKYMVFLNKNFILNFFKKPLPGSVSGFGKIEKPGSVISKIPKSGSVLGFRESSILLKRQTNAT